MLRDQHRCGMRGGDKERVRRRRIRLNFRLGNVLDGLGGLSNVVESFWGFKAMHHSSKSVQGMLRYGGMMEIWLNRGKMRSR